jgi:hypothetical protein
MTKQKLIMENWRRFLKEQKEETFEEALENTPIEEGGGLVAAFMALVGMSGEMPQDMQGVEINGQNYTIEQMAQAHNKLEKLTGKEKHASAAEDGQEALVDAVHDAIVLERDADGDGFYELTNDNWSGSYQQGLVYGSMALKTVTKASQPDAGQDTGSPDTGELKDVRGAKATNVDAMAAMLINSGQSKIMTPEKRLAKAKKLLEIGNSDQGNMSPETKQALEKFIANGGK